VVVAVVVLFNVAQTEKQRFEQALKHVEKNEHREAASLLDQLLAEYPKSNQADEYRLVRALMAARQEVDSITLADHLPEALAATRTFVTNFSNQPKIERYRLKAYELVEKLAATLVSKAESLAKAKQFAQAQERLTEADALTTDGRKLAPADVGASALLKIAGQIETLRTQMASEQRKHEFLQLIAGRYKPPLTRAQVDELDRLAASENLRADPDFAAFRERSTRSSTQNFGYEPDQSNASPAPDDTLPGVLLVPRLDTPEARLTPTTAPAPAASVERNGVFYAVARGVLYALAEEDGRRLWATRVGLDAEGVPVSVPAEAVGRPMVLVLANDGMALTGRDPRDGTLLWYQPLGGTALGKPVLIGKRAYQPLRDEKGTVLEFEVISGTRIGKITLGEPLGAGATSLGSLLFCPVFARSVYVIDVEAVAPDASRKPACLTTLDTKHGAGTLRGAPVLVGLGGHAPATLILAQADGLEAMKLHAFALPPASALAETPLRRAQSVEVAGWSAFTPFCDGERLAVVTDTGALGLFGVNQPGNTDGLLFPLPAPTGLPAPLNVGRSQIVSADDSNLWLISGGRLFALRVGIVPNRGLVVAPSWKTPVDVGTPLHEGQMGSLRDTVFAVTLAPDASACWATAVEAATGRLRWKRQLGAVPTSTPVKVGNAVLVLDAGGGLYKLSPERLPIRPGVEWQIDDKMLQLPPLNDVVGPPQLLLAHDGQTGVLVTSTRTSSAERLRRGALAYQLLVRQYPLTPGTDRAADAPAPLAGSAVRVGETVVLPLADGTIRRLRLTGTAGLLETGPSWRSPGVNATTPGQLIALGPDEFVSTDGSRELLRWQWPAGQLFRARQSLRLPFRVQGVPVALPGGRLALADSTGGVLVLTANPQAGGDLTLNPTQTWRRSGAVTAGPFVTTLADGSVRLSAVWNRKHLLWLDPSQPKPLWELNASGAGYASGPQSMATDLVIADVAGQYQRLNPATGLAQGAAFVLPGSAAPATLPLAFGPERLLAPLSDGTLALLPFPFEVLKAAK
jgi:outer membrane protein assembly factor BamB